MTLDTIIGSDTTVTFLIPLVALLTSFRCRKESIWNFSVLQRLVLQILLFVGTEKDGNVIH
jgi:hypothetical protein